MSKIGTICAAAVVAMLGRPARAEDAPVVPAASASVFVGLGSGVGADVWAGDRLRADVELGTLTFGPVYWGSAGLVGRVVGTQRTFLGVRAGYQLELEEEKGDGTWSGSRSAQAFDAGLVARAQTARGSAVEAQIGAEEVFRASAAVCCDDAPLATRSLGLRASLLGELALSNELALFARAGVRTADHVLELKWLPTASVGVRYRF